MTELHDKPRLRQPGVAPGLFTATGIASAFGAAACCGLPLVLASAGLGTAWLGSVASLTFSYRVPLLVIAAVSLFAGTVLLWREQRAARSCTPQGVCAKPGFRVLTFLGLVAGMFLLWLGYSYV